MPKINTEYKRKHGNKGVVTVLSISEDGTVKIKDADGIHFVKASTFYQFFEEASK